MPERWSGWLLQKSATGEVQAALQSFSDADLPPGEVLIRVEYSSVNYKDALVMTGRLGIVRQYPLVPGIDLAGVVEASNEPYFQPGDRVLVTGQGLGEAHWGGYAQKARVPAEWLLRLPDGVTTWQAMALGTAGFTAMLCVLALEEHGLTHSDGSVLVTGAMGGVGSLAVYLLSRRGYSVTAVTGRLDQAAYLHGLGATEVIDRARLLEEPQRPLLSERWAGAIDVVGGQLLAGVLRSMRYGASVAACGLAGGSDLPTTVFPFILRGVNLLGIDSVACPRTRRIAAWKALARDVDPAAYAQFARTIGVPEVLDVAHEILAGKVQGRLVVDVAGYAADRAN